MERPGPKPPVADENWQGYLGQGTPVPHQAPHPRGLVPGKDPPQHLAVKNSGDSDRWGGTESGGKTRYSFKGFAHRIARRYSHWAPVKEQ